MKRPLRPPDPILRRWQPVRSGDDGALSSGHAKDGQSRLLTFFTSNCPMARAVITPANATPMAAVPVEATWRGGGFGGRRDPASPSACPELARPGGAPPPLACADPQALVRIPGQHDRQQEDRPGRYVPSLNPSPRYRRKEGRCLLRSGPGDRIPRRSLFSKRGNGEAARWECAIALFADLAIRVRLKDREVFSEGHSARWGNARSSTLSS